MVNTFGLTGVDYKGFSWPMLTMILFGQDTLTKGALCLGRVYYVLSGL